MDHCWGKWEKVSEEFFFFLVLFNNLLNFLWGFIDFVIFFSKIIAALSSINHSSWSKSTKGNTMKNRLNYIFYLFPSFIVDRVVRWIGSNYFWNDWKIYFSRVWWFLDYGVFFFYQKNVALAAPKKYMMVLIYQKEINFWFFFFR